MRMFRVVILLAIYLGLLVDMAFAQCPTSVCPVSTGVVGSNDGLLLYRLDGERGVVFPSGYAQSEGSFDSSCNASLRDTLLAGKTYQFVAVVSSTDTQVVKVWIDFSNDGIFTIAELVVDTFGVDTIKSFFTVPSAASIAVNSTVRVRVLAVNKIYYDALGPGTIGACNSPIDSGQYEDYSVFLTSKPQADFTFNSSCNGQVQFTDQSLYNPTSWQWDFGDGNTSTLQNPTHTYASSGIYTVQLIVSNQWGSDTIVKSVPAIYPPVSACTPGTGATCCGEGIFQYQLFGEIGVSNTSGDAATEGYVDFSCDPYLLDILYLGGTYTLRVQTDPTSTQMVRVWIDFNNDGVFDSTEKVMESIGVQTHIDSFIVPLNAVTYTVLRVRVMAAAYNSTWPAGFPGPCDIVDYGQYEDYAVYITSPPVPPIADFVAIPDETCDGIVQFYDRSRYVPTSWQWDFGDGNTSNQQNPLHTYTTSGIYNVRLIVSNSYGVDTAYKTVRVSLGAAPDPAPVCTPEPAQSPCLDYGIYEVELYSLFVTSGCSDEGYQDFTCVDTVHIMEGKWHNIRLKGHPDFPQDWRIYIDYNNDGNFTHDELALKVDYRYPDNQDGDHFLRMRVKGGNVVLNTPIRMRIITDVAGNIQFNDNACYIPLRGQVEDYTVVLKENPYPPVANFAAPQRYFDCFPAIAVFYDSSENAITSWHWDFGDGRTSTEPNPIHYYLLPGVYTVTLTVCGPVGCDTIVKPNYITVSDECPTIMSASSYKWVYDCEGILYDDGGPNGNYLYFGRGAVHIYPMDADTVWIQFLEFEFVDNEDFLFIYCSGDTTQAPDYSFTGSTLPNNGQPIACPTGQMLVKTILVNSPFCPGDPGCTAPGFRAKWWSDAKTKADFDLGYFATDLDVCDDEYLFINRSYCADKALWFFEDFAYDTAFHTYHKFYGESRTPVLVDIDFPSSLFTGQNPYRDGYYEVVLVSENDYGFKDTVKKRVIINKLRGEFGVDPMPATILDNPITFYDMTQPPYVATWTWKFEDGFISNKPFFRRTIDTPGVYKVELIVCGAVCCDTVVKIITVYEQDPFTYSQAIQSNNFRVFPNPISSGEHLFIEAPTINNEHVNLTIRDLTGKILFNQKFIASNNKLAVPILLPPGTYVIELINQDGQIVGKERIQVIDK